jgi:hypothetical protein
VTDWKFDDDLGAALVDLGRYVDVPDHSLWTRVRAALDDDTKPRASVQAWKRWAVVAGILAALAIAVIAIAPARHAVADLLGIGATRVEHVRELPSVDARASLPSRGDRAELSARLARERLYAPSAELSGEAVAWKIDPRGETVVVYERLALSQRPLAGAAPAVKRLPTGGNVQFVHVGGSLALFLRGEHTRTLDGHTYRSTNALVWDVDDVELRLESDAPLAEILQMARSVTRAT